MLVIVPQYPVRSFDRHDQPRIKNQAILDYYTQQSRFTTPGDYARLFETLPDDIAGLCKVVQGIVFHYMADGYDIPPERLPEVDTRYVEKILAHLIELDHRPLIEPRPIEKRIIGCCRDFAVLFCAMARFKGIPCRVRVGFAAYINIGASGFYVDHEIAEYWDSEAMRWRLVDPEQTAALIEFNQITFDVTDIPGDMNLLLGVRHGKPVSKAKPTHSVMGSIRAMSFCGDGGLSVIV